MGWRLGAAALVATGALIGACSKGESANYPAGVKSNFMTACVATSADRSGCQCALDAFERSYTLDEFMAMDRVAANGYMAPKLQEIFLRCGGN